jgi:predicted acetyltransferase
MTWVVPRGSRPGWRGWRPTQSTRRAGGSSTTAGSWAGSHELDDRTGHIGYGIRPSARGRGLATWALAAVLEEARRRGMDRVLLVCADENAASTRTIERNGGVLAEVRVTPRGTTRRYWIDLQT